MNKKHIHPHFYLYVLIFILVLLLINDVGHNDITGMVTKSITKKLYHSVDESFTESGVYVWNPDEKNIKNVELDADIFGTGDVLVSLINGGKSVVLLKRYIEDEIINVEDYVELPEGTNIGLTLEYGGGNWDENNDGLASYKDGIDFKIKPIFFSLLSKESLCTLWEVFNFETEDFNSVCYGSSSCCNFLGLSSSVDEWDEDYVLVKGNQGSSNRNIVLSRLVFYNSTHTSYSNYDGLVAIFADEGELQEFVYNEDEFNSDNYLIRVELDDAVLHLNGIKYFVEEKIETLDELKKTDVSMELESIYETQEPIELLEKTNEGYQYIKEKINESFKINLNEGYIESITVSPSYYLDEFKIDIKTQIQNNSQVIDFKPGSFFDSVYLLKIPNDLLEENDLLISTDKGYVKPTITKSDDKFTYFRAVSELRFLKISFVDNIEEIEFKSYNNKISPFIYFIISVLIALLVFLVYNYSAFINKHFHLNDEYDHVKKLMEQKVLNGNKTLKKKEREILCKFNKKSKEKIKVRNKVKNKIIKKKR